MFYFILCVCIFYLFFFYKFMYVVDFCINISILREVRFFFNDFFCNKNILKCWKLR